MKQGAFKLKRKVSINFSLEAYSDIYSLFLDLFNGKTNLVEPSIKLLSILKEKREIKPYEWKLYVAKLFNCEESSKEVSSLEKKKWNSSIHNYYTILKHLQSIGILEKKGKTYVYSEIFKERTRQMSNIIQSFLE